MHLITNSPQSPSQMQPSPQPPEIISKPKPLIGRRASQQRRNTLDQADGLIKNPKPTKTLDSLDLFMIAFEAENRRRLGLDKTPPKFSGSARMVFEEARFTKYKL